MSRQYLGPYINFHGRARDAMEFYHKVLGGRLDLQTMTQQGAFKPAGPGARIMNGRLEAVGAFIIIGTDGHPDYAPTVGDHMAVALGGADKARLTKIFSDLAEGGKVKGPLAKQPWGAEVGWLVDKFGVNWTVTVEMSK